MRNLRFLAIATSAGAAALAAFLCDPRSGRRRRALLRDQSIHVARVARRRSRGTLGAIAGPSRGLAHTLAGLCARCWGVEEPDGVELKNRVESELGRDQSLRLGHLNFDADCGIVHIRGTEFDAVTAQRIVEKTAGVQGVRAVVSLMRGADGTPVGGMAGDLSLVDSGPRAALRAESVRGALFARWPFLSDADILAGEGHLGTLSATIGAHTGEAVDAIRVELEEILLAAV